MSIVSYIRPIPDTEGPLPCLYLGPLKQPIFHHHMKNAIRYSCFLAKGAVPFDSCQMPYAYQNFLADINGLILWSDLCLFGVHHEKDLIQKTNIVLDVDTVNKNHKRDMLWDQPASMYLIGRYAKSGWSIYMHKIDGYVVTSPCFYYKELKRWPSLIEFIREEESRLKDHLFFKSHAAKWEKVLRLRRKTITTRQILNFSDFLDDKYKLAVFVDFLEVYGLVNINLRKLYIESSKHTSFKLYEQDCTETGLLIILREFKKWIKKKTPYLSNLEASLFKLRIKNRINVR